MIEQRVTLRYDAQQIPAIVQAVQGDTGRDVIFELADYEIPAGATANYYIDKPDGNAVYNSAEVISSTEILAHLTEQALAVPGRNNGQVRILSDDEVITSFDFVLEVEAFRGLMRMQSETEVNIFDEALQAAAEDAIEEIQAQTPVVTGMQNSIAPSYSSSNTYAVGNYVMYNAQLYRCVVEISTGEAWNAAHWTQVPIASDVSDLKSALLKLSESVKVQTTYGAYVDNTTSVIDFTPIPYNNYAYAIDDCEQGDIYTIYGRGSVKPRLWAFADENGNRISYSDMGLLVEGLQIVAPQNAKKVVFGFYTTPYPNYRVYKQSKQDYFIDYHGIPSGSDLNDYLTNGQYYITSSVRPTLQNYPSNTTGRLLVFGDKNVDLSIRVQIIIDADNHLYHRYYSGSWGKWKTGLLDFHTLISTPGETSAFHDADNFPLNSFVSINTNGIAMSILNMPDFNASGFMFTISQDWTTKDPSVQAFVTMNGEGMAFRTYVTSSGWSDWLYHGCIVEKYVSAPTAGEGINFSNLAWGIRYMMRNFNKWSEHHRCDIELKEGEYDLSSVVSYIGDGSLDERGLFITPYCHLHGAGKEKSIVKFMYDGNDDDIMTLVSGLNITYESIVENLTIEVKNIRYTVHSDNGMTTMPGITASEELLKNNQITLNNVKLIHHGFDSGKNPTYNVPSTWGSGSFDNANQKFTNCDFIAAQCTAWLNHTKTTNTKPCNFDFENCAFVNGNNTTFTESNGFNSCFFISWGQGFKNTVNMKNCKVNRFVSLSVVTTQGNENAVCDYNVYIDNDIPVIEYERNNSHYLDNYRTSNTAVGFCTESSGIVAYKPVSASMFIGVKAYDSTLENVENGIAVCSASNGNEIVYQNKGLVYLAMLTSTVFTAGQEIGYENGSWTASATKKIIKVVNQYFGKIIETI